MSAARLCLAVLPLLLFSSLVLVFYLRIGAGDPATLPSALIGRDVPDFSLPALDQSGVPGFSTADLKQGRITLVNVWASWCLPCREEHRFLVSMASKTAAKDVQIFGLNYKDSNDAALKFLIEAGNPYSRIGVDDSGRTGIDWGVYGVPETFLVDGQGKIIFKHVGPVTQEVWIHDFLPLLKAEK